MRRLQSIAAITIAFQCVACGGSALEANARAVQGSYAFLEGTKAVVEARLEAVQRPHVEAMRRGELTAEETRRQVALARVREVERLDGVIAAHNAMAEAHDAYATGLLMLYAEERLTWSSALALAAQVYNAMRAVLHALQQASIAPPDIPDALADVFRRE